MRNKFILFFILAFAFFAEVSNTFAITGKYLVILQAGRETHEGMARAVHALLYAQELKEHGHEVVLLFDGAGTEWINEWNNPDSQDKLKIRYEALKKAGATQIICDFCATAFNARKSLDVNHVPLTAEFEGHPSIAKWIDQGYQLIVL